MAARILKEMATKSAIPQTKNLMDFTMRESRLLPSQFSGAEGYLWLGWRSSGLAPRAKLVMEKEEFRPVAAFAEQAKKQTRSSAKIGKDFNFNMATDSMSAMEHS
mmetsp:Transcript_347/g.1171  ORF Transcript_347/g.1171 Transcript_347/m.1171 type:complete len:105 (-) Transcript_347:96-410(-)